MGLIEMRTMSLTDILMANSVGKRVITAATAITLALSGLTPAHAQDKEKKENTKKETTIEKKVEADLEEDPQLGLVPLAPMPINKPSPPPIGPLSALMVDSISIPVEGDFNEYNNYIGRLDVNRDGKRDTKVVVEFTENRVSSLKIQDTRSGRERRPDMISVVDGTTVAMYKTLSKGRNLAFMVSGDRQGLYINAYATVKVPDSVREKSLRGKDTIDNVIFCDIDTGCFNAPYYTVQQIIDNRPQEISDYFDKIIRKTHQVVAHPKFRYTIREAGDYIINNATELKSQIKEEYKQLGVSMKQYERDSRMVTHLTDEALQLMDENYERWARGEPLSKTLAREAGMFTKVKPEDKAVADASADDAGQAAKESHAKPSDKYAGKAVDEPEARLQDADEGKKETLVKKKSVEGPESPEKLERIAAGAEQPGKYTSDKPYLPDTTRPDITAAKDTTGTEQWYEKWWVWTIAGGVALGAAATTAGVLLSKDRGSSTSTGPDNFIMDYGDYNRPGGR